MIHLESIKKRMHSPKEWDEYMKGNISLQDIVATQMDLMEWSAALAKEQELTSKWLKQTNELLAQRLQQIPAA